MTPEDWRPATPEEHQFDERFFTLAGHQPFRWQWRLFEHFAKSERGSLRRHKHLAQLGLGAVNG